MKILFAVNNEKVSGAIIKKYQSMYKEIISAKNVYFFNAIIKELQKDKSYDRIVIGEDLEPYSNNNYEVIDNFLFDKLDSISDEASNSIEGDIPIILIATDRREKNDGILVKLFGIGIYNALLGKDRSIEGVCRLINQPRTKKEAKAYYKIESDDVEYQAIDPDSVSETEIQNIIRHYKKLGKNEEKYVQSFNDIASQYTDTQLKLITKFLPLNVRAVLEEKCPKYQQVMIGSVKGQINKKTNQKLNNYTSRNLNGNSNSKIELIDRELQKSKLTKPVVIPSAINMQNVKKAYTNTSNEPVRNMAVNATPVQNDSSITNTTPVKDNIANDAPVKNNGGMTSESLNQFEQKSNVQIASQIDNIETQNVEQPKKGRGRPRKEKTQEELEKELNKEKRGRGRPKKVSSETENINVSENTDIDLFGLANDTQNNNVTPTVTQNTSNVQQMQEDILPGLEETTLPGVEETTLPGFEDTTLPGLEETTLPGLEEETFNTSSNYMTGNNNNVLPNNNFNNKTEIQTTNTSYQEDRDLSYLLTGDKKIVSFVGTSKNGTSFLVNNLAVQLSNKGINTAILDLTKNKNSYYIFTANEESLRNISFRCIENLRSGRAEGIQVNKNLTVYTTLPGEDEGLNDYGNVLETLLKNYSLILLDCDFETNQNYFAKSQEIYLVQTYDILTIQPLTAFLNELKYKNILDQEKLRIVINKTLNLRKLTEQMIIGGISCYNDPASTYLNKLFDQNTIRYTTIPFEDQTYARYLERLVDCEISLNGYSKIFLDALEKLSNMVYPLIAGKTKYETNKNYNDYSRKNSTFNSNMNETLNKMRKNF